MGVAGSYYRQFITNAFVAPENLEGENGDALTALVVGSMLDAAAAGHTAMNWRVCLLVAVSRARVALSLALPLSPSLVTLSLLARARALFSAPDARDLSLSPAAGSTTTCSAARSRWVRALA